MWKPCLPGLRFWKSATTRTSSPVLVNVTVPVTWLPDFGSRAAVAFVTSCACAKTAKAHNTPRDIIILFMPKGTVLLDKMKLSIEQALLDSRIRIYAQLTARQPVHSSIGNGLTRIEPL